MNPTSTTENPEVRRSRSACSNSVRPAPSSTEPWENRISASKFSHPRLGVYHTLALLLCLACVGESWARQRVDYSQPGPPVYLEDKRITESSGIVASRRTP